MLEDAIWERARQRVGSSLLGKYRLDRLLGIGGMGAVYEATQRIGGKYAVKVLHGARSGETAAHDAFLREAMLANRVEHPGALRVLDADLAQDGCPFFVMPLLDGETLRRRHERTGRPLPLGEVVALALALLDTLDAAHAKRIVHRDIKPENLFLTRTEGLKVLDFGIARLLSGADVDVTQSGHATGTPAFMAPEQALGNTARIDPRTDLWAVGATIFFLLSGQFVHDGTTWIELATQVATRPARSLETVAPDVPARLRAVVDRALQFERDARWTDAASMRAALRSAWDASGSGAIPDLTCITETMPRHDGGVSVPEAAVPARRGGATDVLAATERALGDGASPPDLRRIVVATSDDGSAAPAPRTTPARRVTRWLGAVALPVAVVVVVMVIRARSGTSQLVSARPVTTDAATPAPVSITDLPAPNAASLQAQLEYRVGIQAIRNGSLILADNAFRRALTSDPTFAAAHLRVAIYGDWLARDEAMSHVRSAFAYRTQLSTRDQALLDVLEPLCLSPTPDIPEGIRRMDALARSAPADMEIRLLAVYLFFDDRPPAEARRMIEEIVTLDPKFALAWWLRATLEMHAGDEGTALTSVAACLRASSVAASCLRVRATVEERSDCAALEADAQRMLIVEGDSFRAHEFLARALLARGASGEAVHETLERKWKGVHEGARRQTQLIDEVHLAIARGDFASAARVARAREEVAMASDAEVDRGSAALMRIAIHAEMGEPKVAAQVADTFLRRRGAWPATDVIEADPRPQLYAAAVRGGLRSPRERDSVRAEWLTLWKGLVPAPAQGNVWLEGFGASAETREDAVMALAALDDYPPLARTLRGVPTAPTIGKVHALAERYDDAIRELRLGTASCRLLEEPLELTRASYFLGVSLEATGDRDGACAAYARVVERWGNAKPRSVTADAAKKRARALDCPPAR